MYQLFRKELTSVNVYRRIAATCVLFLALFLTITVISYFLLPEGLLRGRHPAQHWETSDNVLVSTLQIFLFNQLSVVVILIGNTFASREKPGQEYFPVGYLAFFTQTAINAVTLGTWSFAVVSDAIPLLDRIVGTFDVLHRAGLWEMSGQLLILCASAKSSMILTDGRKTAVRSWKEVRLSKQEIILLIVGIILMFAGALIESLSIIRLTTMQ